MTDWKTIFDEPSPTVDRVKKRVEARFKEIMEEDRIKKEGKEVAQADAEAMKQEQKAQDEKTREQEEHEQRMNMGYKSDAQRAREMTLRLEKFRQRESKK
ncbi:hypothetical protein B9Z65_1186 [Elsinoe australis]|uniref:Uncharacterized protein n=1 Tax=Elsinoe australis TaxID=40998 RepID=A0A2P7YPU5_9PEZI|nr:hypothetical protein B9Z65_1186 [Elsinoe australis]